MKMYSQREKMPKQLDRIDPTPRRAKRSDCAREDGVTVQRTETRRAPCLDQQPSVHVQVLTLDVCAPQKVCFQCEHRSYGARHGHVAFDSGQRQSGGLRLADGQGQPRVDRLRALDLLNAGNGLDAFMWNQRWRHPSV